MKKRDEISKEYFWSLDQVFTSEEEITKSKEKIDGLVQEILKYQESITKNSENLTNVLDLYYEVFNCAETLYVYHSHLLDQDHSNSQNQGKLLNLTTFFNEITAKLSFIIPEITKENEEILKDYINNNDNLKKYKKQIIEIIEEKSYVLSEKEEKIMSYASPLTNIADDIYSTLTNSDLKFEDVLDEEGNQNKFNEAVWSKNSQSYDRVLRKNSFESLLNGYGNFNQTFCKIYLSELQSKKFSLNVRGYENLRQRALFNNRIDENIYDNLIKSVHKNINYNHQYLKIRKDLLNVEELHLYDVYVPLLPENNTEYKYEEAVKLVKESLNILGDEYINDINHCFENKWIDVFPNEGKRSGAYSGGSYQTNPFILLNYTETLNDIFTLTHELGHSMHSFYTNKTQNYQNTHYKIFVAEIASTVNELLLLNHLLENSNNKNEKLHLLNYAMDQFRSTVYRQTMFAEFEQISNKKFCDGEEINNEVLNEEYYKLNQMYFGDEVCIDDLIKYEWTRIPHFYYNFYVYQYATSFCIAVKVSQDIIAGNQELLKNYLEFLKLGDSKTPIEAIKKLGIDVTDEKVFDQALNKYGEIIKEFSKEV